MQPRRWHAARGHRFDRDVLDREVRRQLPAMGARRARRRDALARRSGVRALRGVPRLSERQRRERGCPAEGCRLDPRQRALPRGPAIPRSAATGRADQPLLSVLPQRWPGPADRPEPHGAAADGSVRGQGRPAPAADPASGPDRWTHPRGPRQRQRLERSDDRLRRQHAGQHRRADAARARHDGVDGRVRLPDLCHRAPPDRTGRSQPDRRRSGRDRHRPGHDAGQPRRGPGRRDHEPANPLDRFRRSACPAEVPHVSAVHDVPDGQPTVPGAAAGARNVRAVGDTRRTAPPAPTPSRSRIPRRRARSPTIATTSRMAPRATAGPMRGTSPAPSARRPTCARSTGARRRPSTRRPVPPGPTRAPCRAAPCRRTVAGPAS